MRHPSEYFIKSLIVSGKLDKEIRELLLEFGLPELTAEYTDYMSNLRADTLLDQPGPYTGIRDEDRDFLVRHKIDGLLHPDCNVAHTTTLLALPYVRRDIFLGLLGRIDSGDLSEHISHKYNVDAQYVHVAAIAHYYFNVEIVSPDEWHAIFSRVVSDQESQLHYSCLMGGPVVASYKLGIERHVSIKDAVHEVVRALHTTLHEIKDRPASPAKLKMLSETMSALAKAHMVLNTSDQELAAVASELKTFKLSRNTKKPIPLALLSKKKVAG
jgi:hypothetical protein